MLRGGAEAHACIVVCSMQVELSRNIQIKKDVVVVQSEAEGQACSMVRSMQGQPSLYLKAGQRDTHAMWCAVCRAS